MPHYLTEVPCEEVGRVNRPIEDEPYYHGFMARNEAEALLTQHGEFLVRKTSVGGAVWYVISLSHEQKMHNFIIKRTNKKRLYWVYKWAFKKVGDLVQHHHKHGEPISDDGIRILKPCFKQDWQLNHEQVELKNKLGEGAFGEVKKGELQVSPFVPRIPVAVKTLTTNTLSGDERIKFLKEANLMLPLSHANVIKLYGVCTAKEPIMIVMELANTSLLAKLQDTEEPPSMADKVNFVYGAARGMAYLESQNIIHRDIAARNCLVGYQNEVKISDFGLSILGNEFREKKMKTVPLRWMAPETLRRGRYSHKSDVYSFGILMWEIYSKGEEPFEGTDGAELKRLIIDRKISLRDADMQAEVASLWKRCGNYEPEARPTFAEIEGEVAQMNGVIRDKSSRGWFSCCVVRK